MKLTTYLGGAYNNHANKHTNTIMNCDTCKEGNDQNAVIEKTTQTGIREGLCEERGYYPGQRTTLQMKGSPRPQSQRTPAVLITGSGVKVGSSGGAHFPKPDLVLSEVVLWKTVGEKEEVR